MAGTNAAFNADEFRTAIRSAMVMGAPSATQQQVTFRWKAGSTYQKQDKTSRPYDWTSNPTEVENVPDDTIIPVAVEFEGGAQQIENPVGQFNTKNVTLTVLDNDYGSVIGASEVLIGGNTYEIDFVYPEGLFDVTIYRIYCRSRDES